MCTDMLHLKVQPVPVFTCKQLCHPNILQYPQAVIWYALLMKEPHDTQRCDVCPLIYGHALKRPTYILHSTSSINTACFMMGHVHNFSLFFFNFSLLLTSINSLGIRAWRATTHRKSLLLLLKWSMRLDMMEDMQSLCERLNILFTCTAAVFLRMSHKQASR